MGMTLEELFAEPWKTSSHEKSDRFKHVSVQGVHNRPSMTLWLTDDGDIAPYGAPIQCKGRQTSYSGTPFGMFTLGYSDGSNFVDAGSCGCGMMNGNLMKLEAKMGPSMEARLK